MKLKTSASAVVLTLLLASSAAVAQTTPPAQRPPAAAPTATPDAPKMPVTGQILAQDANTVLAKDLIGATIYAPDKTKVGSISDLILAKDGRTVEGFVVGVGGFLGIGEKSVAMKMDRLQIAQGAQGGLELTMDAKKEELTNAPTFKSKRDQDADRHAAERPRVQPGVPASRP
jgi:sporulation protein YlmC with PRC-barrel domain